MKKQDLQLCPLCETPLVREPHNISMVYKDKHQQPGGWCSGCGDGFFSAEDLVLSRQERSDKKRIIDHRLISDEIKKFLSLINCLRTSKPYME